MPVELGDSLFVCFRIEQHAAGGVGVERFAASVLVLLFMLL